MLVFILYIYSLHIYSNISKEERSYHCKMSFFLENKTKQKLYLAKYTIIC